MPTRWSMPGGYREVLAISLPLAVSMGSTSVMHFTDRMFLGNYSLDALAASLPAGITSFLFIAFFLGVGTYVNVFVAQYVGAGQGRRVGASLWQGIYFSILAAAGLASLYFAAPFIFSLAGHPPGVQGLEVSYFRVLTLGAGFNVLAATLSCFFSGQGITRAVMIVNLSGALINIPLDYALINGVWFFPELGMVGAGLATVIGMAFNSAFFALIIFTRANQDRFSVRTSRAWDGELFSRLMRYGLPSGAQFFLDMAAVTFFVFMMGRLGRVELAACNIVFALSTLAFMPVVGMGIAAGTMVGQAIGAGRPERAVRATNSTVHLAMLYMGSVGLVYVIFPHFLLDLFGTHGQGAQEFAPVVPLGVMLLRFVALYSLGDAVAIIYSGAIKGAGDTRFVMYMIVAYSLALIVLPVGVGIEYFGMGLYGAWWMLTIYVAALGLTLLFRFRQGRWQSMRVIEKQASARP